MKKLGLLIFVVMASGVLARADQGKTPALDSLKDMTDGVIAAQKVPDVPATSPADDDNTSEHPSVRHPLDCVATKVLDTSYLEESLSVEEYPWVRVMQDMSFLRASLGSSFFDTHSGAKIEVLPTVGFGRSFRIKARRDDRTFTIITRTVMATPRPIQIGQLLGSRDGKKQDVIAELTCK